MKVLVTGAGGQLGQELLRTVPAGVSVEPLERGSLDLTNPGAVGLAVAELKPNLVINAAAYTAVDRAEQEPEAAAAVNHAGAANLAAAAELNGARLIHLSTDFVFDGRHSVPYRPEDHCVPLGVYGATKRAGEVAVLERSGGRALVIRTAWLYASGGNNFVKTMLRLMGERDEIGVVADQVGTPTWARGLAELCWKAAVQPELSGIYHWSDAGVASWYDFAVAVAEEGAALGLLDGRCRVRPIATADYRTPAARPAFSVLDKSATWRDLEVTPVHWRVQLRAMMQELLHA